MLSMVLHALHKLSMVSIGRLALASQISSKTRAVGCAEYYSLLAITSFVNYFIG